jgi:hypothetical protein
MRIRRFPLVGLGPIELLGGGLLLWHIDKVVKHQRNCEHCAGRDFVAIAADLPHLWSTNATG